MEQTFETFEQVLGKEEGTGFWRPDIFLYYDDIEKSYPYVCSRNRYAHCIPYKDNESLKLTNHIPPGEEEAIVFDKSKNVPASLKDAPRWAISIYFSFKGNLCSYAEICSVLGYKSIGSLTTIFSSDPDAPTPIRMGKKAFFPREEVVLWLIKRAKNSRRRWRFTKEK